MIKTYLGAIIKTTTQGDAREESYYSALAQLLNSYGVSIGRNKTQITILPKKTDAGNPDFRIWDGNQNIVGYIEAKKPGENLDFIERKDQLKRYKSTFPNLILTDFYEFRLYRNGELTDKTYIGLSNLAKKGIPPPAENIQKFLDLLQKFFGFSLPTIRNASELAKELAKRTRFLRDEVITLEIEQHHKGKGELYGFYETFKKFLIANLSEKDFADLFSQTITYGLFAARTRSINGFNRKLAYDLIPKTIGILRNIFKFVSQGDLPQNMEVMIDDIAEVLNVTDVKNILQQYYQVGKGEDPIVHFYETFLTAYDPATREKRGVYYTPQSVVRYIVRSVHSILKSHFRMSDGLADEGVTLLDPAGGTLTFPAEAIKLAVQEYTNKYGEGGIERLISNQILKNFYAFELMMAPYAIGHIKISFLLEELGHTLRDDERFKLYLTNTLDMEDLQMTQIPGLQSLSEESHEAGKIKKDEPLLVIIGNPPYSGISSNMTQWQQDLVKKNMDGAQSYYEIDGKKLEEKKLWLQDDYVKFIRFAQWKIHKAGRGIVAMITNHSYLDNPTFRGMRQSLMKTFNEIYIVDLHGNSLKKETSPDGDKDVNVFDIQQGVAIAIFVKISEEKSCKIYHHDLFGSRENKYNWLNENEFKISDYQLLNPKTPWYFFIKRNTAGIEYYLDWMKVNEIFPINVTGIVTARDNLAIDFNLNDLALKINQFRDINIPDELIREIYGLPDNYQWKLNEQRILFRKVLNWKEQITKILYRPFDIRFICYQENIVFRTRRDIMQNMKYPNLGFCFIRQYSGNSNYSHAFITDKMIDNRTFFSSKGIIQEAPLYIYQSQQRGKNSNIMMNLLFEDASDYFAKRPNIDNKTFEILETAYKTKPTPEQILYYCYAILYSNIYREKYAEYLKIDFPRIPFTSDFNTFVSLSKNGEKLTQLHLLTHKSLENPIVKFRGKGDFIIEKTEFKELSQLLYINENNYFDGITIEMWEYQIGGYQIAKKWLDWRKGREVETKTYCRILTAIAETIKLQSEIDIAFEILESNNIINFVQK